MKFRKLPVVVEAVYFNENGIFEENPEWLNEAINEGEICVYSDGYFVRTLEGVMTGLPCTYIVRGIEGELYPCDGDIFRKTYERIDASHV